MSKRTLIGVLTPSSNTALEPLTSRMVALVPGASAHFARFPVTEISLRDASLQQFDDRKILDAAPLAGLRHRRTAVPAHPRGHRPAGHHLGAGAQRGLGRARRAHAGPGDAVR